MTFVGAILKSVSAPANVCTGQDELQLHIVTQAPWDGTTSKRIEEHLKILKTFQNKGHLKNYGQVAPSHGSVSDTCIHLCLNSDLDSLLLLKAV